MIRNLALLILACICLASQAQTVWRCGPDGRTYSAEPCANGAAVDVSDPRSDAEREAARAVTNREREALKTLAAERHQRDQEARARGLGPAGIRYSAAALSQRTTSTIDNAAASRKDKKKPKRRVERKPRSG